MVCVRIAGLHKQRQHACKAVGVVRIVRGRKAGFASTTIHGAASSIVASTCSHFWNGREQTFCEVWLGTETNRSTEKLNE